MKFLIITLFCLTGYIVCLNPHGGLTIPEVVEKLWQLGDLDHDNYLSLNEFLAEFLTSYDHDHSGAVTSHEFVVQYQHNYHENHQVVLHIFQHFDIDKNGVLTDHDLSTLFHLIDHNVDNLMEHSEFSALMGYVYGTLPLPETP